MRRRIPAEIEESVLVLSRRRCCLCFGLNRDLAIKQGQIAHLDGRPDNNDLDNLAFMCLEHHDQYDTRTSQSKGLTAREAKRFRKDLHEVIEKFIDQEQRRTIDLASKSDLSLSQPRGHGDNIHSVYSDSDPRLVVIRDVVIVNRSDRDDVVTLKLWLPLDKEGLLFSPQTKLPSRDIGQVSLLKAVENIPSRKSVSGDLLFSIPRNSIPNISSAFFIITATSQLTGIEHAFNTLDFTEVTKPYPRDIDELNEQLASR